LEKAQEMNKNTPEYYDKLFSSKTRWRRWAYDLVLSRIPDRFVPASVADVGCAMGDGLLVARKRWPKAEMTGVDFSPVGLDVTRRRLGTVTTHCIDLEGAKTFPFRAALVLCCETLEHLSNPHEVEALLRESSLGLVGVTVPCRGKVNDVHLSRFDPEWFEKRGYEVWVVPRPKDKSKKIIVALWRKHHGKG
jgi:trans-aconitate methyltransferase